jgi:dihydroorotate dehydrogenase electron transfer subunit
MKQSLCTVTSNVEVMPGVYLMWLEAPDIASSAQPGQFITVCCEGLILRRPFSVHQVSFLSSPSTGEDSGEGGIAILFKVVGKGTFGLSKMQAGNKIDVLGPLGKGFDIAADSKNLLLVGGGIGIAPLIFLAQYAAPQCQVTLIHGASTAAQIYPFPSLRAETLSIAKGQRSNLSPLPEKVQFIPVTEDGTLGRKGMVTDILPDFLNWADQICACGPVDMYEAMSLTLNPSLSKGDGEKRSNLRCQVSLEVRMGCGIGACRSCTINTRHGLKQVCRDGPVFELNDILWQEVRI